MIITMTTDFGSLDPFVGIMKGVIAGINPKATVIDLTHGIPAQNVLAGALALRHAVDYFPAGTIHLAVVDPGVGSARRPLLIECGGKFLIGPDNGLLSLAVGVNDPDTIVCLSNSDYYLKPTSTTFHGRDIFAPAAAHLSLGVPVSAFGDKREDFERLAVPKPTRGKGTIRGEIIYIDGFGNLFTNVAGADLTKVPRAGLEVRLGAHFQIRGIAPSYASGAAGDLLAIINSWDVLEIAAAGGNAERHTGARIGDPIEIVFR